MEVTLDKATIDAIAQRVAHIIKKSIKDDEPPEMVTAKEAAAILHISPDRMRRIKDRFPYVKSDGHAGRLLFVRKALLQHDNQQSE